MDKPKLSDREAGFIEAARRELAARASPATRTASEAEPGTAAAADRAIVPPAPQRPSPPPGRPDAAERIAALMQAEHEETVRRKKKLRQYGIVIPAVFLVVALLWVGAAIWRYARI